MGAPKDRIQVLRDELTFLENGGYRSPAEWRPPLIFEDSPTCLKSRCSTYTCLDCALLEFVPLNWVRRCRLFTVPAHTRRCERPFESGC